MMPRRGCHRCRSNSWRDLVPKGIEPQPGLAWVVARLVHHAPLVAREVLLLRKVGHVGSVGQEQQRQRVVRGVETVLRDEGLSSAPVRPFARGPTS